MQAIVLAISTRKHQARVSGFGEEHLQRQQDAVIQHANIRENIRVGAELHQSHYYRGGRNPWLSFCLSLCICTWLSVAYLRTLSTDWLYAWQVCYWDPRGAELIRWAVFENPGSNLSNLATSNWHSNKGFLAAKPHCLRLDQCVCVCERNKDLGSV